MLSSTYFLAKFRFDTAENEPAEKLQNVANNKLINFCEFCWGKHRELLLEEPEDALRVPDDARRVGRAGADPVAGVLDPDHVHLENVDEFWLKS